MRPSFRQIIVAAIVIPALMLTGAYVSCNKKSNSPPAIVKKYPVCAHGGICDSVRLICLCPAGYEDSLCETVSRDKFIGKWNVFEKGTMTPAVQYPITIQAGTNITDIFINNFYNYFITPVKGSVAGDTLYIPSQHVFGMEVFGQGYIYTDVTYRQFGKISMRYEVIDATRTVVNDFGYYTPDGSNPSSWSK